MRRVMSRRALGRGLTLIELLVSLAVLAVLASAAAPFMGDMIANGRLREGGNQVLTETLIAQSEAVKRNGTVRVGLNGSTVTVTDVSVADTPVLLRTRTLVQTVSAPAVVYDFGPEGRPTPFGTSVSVNLGSSAGACSSDLRCPGVRVDAGGAVRFCGNYLEACP